MDYYEMMIISTGSDDGQLFLLFDEKTKIFISSNEAKDWLKEYYSFSGINRIQMYNGDNKKCGYVYEYENSDLSHSPVEKWIQRDWVTVEKCHSDCAFEEIKYEILKDDK